MRAPMASDYTTLMRPTPRACDIVKISGGDSPVQSQHGDLMKGGGMSTEVSIENSAITAASEILSKINGDILFEHIFRKNTDWDEKLDARDSSDFDHAWSVSHEKVTSSCPPEDGPVKDVREAAYKKVYQITKHADLAAYVSDDMGLIALAFKNRLDVEFINNLWKSYTQGEFPA